MKMNPQRVEYLVACLGKVVEVEVEVEPENQRG